MFLQYVLELLYMNKVHVCTFIYLVNMLNTFSLSLTSLLLKIFFTFSLGYLFSLLQLISCLISLIFVCLCVGVMLLPIFVPLFFFFRFVLLPNPGGSGERVAFVFWLIYNIKKKLAADSACAHQFEK